MDSGSGKPSAESPAAAEQFRQQAFDILLAGRALAVSVLPAGANNAGITAVGVLLQESVAAANADPGTIALTVPASCLPVRVLWRIRRDHLGAGLLFLTSAPHGTDADWRALWDLRMEPQLRLATATEVTSACPLLAAESAVAVVPGIELQAPGVGVPLGPDDGGVVRSADSRRLDSVRSAEGDA